MNRFNSKAVAMVLALVLGVSGVWMVHAGIRDNGSIDIKTAFAEGKLKSGSVGVMIIFLSVVISLVCILGHKPPLSVELKTGKALLKWRGDSRDFNQEVMAKFESMLKGEGKNDHNA